MRNKFIKYGMLMGTAFLMPLTAEAAGLEAIDDTEEREFKSIEHNVNNALGLKI